MNISKSIPIPARKVSDSKWNNIPLEKLEVGDSIKLEDISGQGSCGYMKRYATLSNAITRNIVRRGITGSFKLGIYNKGKIKQLRVWRVL